MFGTNPLRKQVLDDGTSLRVQSIWRTIQGEGPYSGAPAIFCRLAGCHFRCYFCDTDFESNYQNILPTPVIVEQVVAQSCGNIKLVVLTGGEPFRQNILPLCSGLADAGFHAQIETAGTFWAPGIGDLIELGVVSIVCSPKAGKVHPKIQFYCQHWKYIIREGEVAEDDGLPNVSTQTPGASVRIARPPRKTDTVWLQPCEEYDMNKFKLFPIATAPWRPDQVTTFKVRDQERSKRNMQLTAELAMKYGYRISLQLHKIIGLD